MGRKLTQSEWLKRAHEVHGDRYDYSLSEYKRSAVPVAIRCRVHGVFYMRPLAHIRGQNCPECSDRKRLTKDEFERRSRLIHGNKYVYDNVVYVNNKTHVFVTCPKHGDFRITPHNHLRGKGCPKCSFCAEMTQDEFIERAKLVHNNYYDYSLVRYTKNAAPITIICPMYGPFVQEANSHLQGHGCPCLDTKYINNSFNKSQPEDDLYGMLCDKFGEKDVERQFVSDLYPFHCDFYIRSRDLYIELNAYWAHNGHWFNPDDSADIGCVETWVRKREAGSVAYAAAIHTFTVSDVLKRHTARKNNLNYVVFWRRKPVDVQEWFALGCPDGRDWEIEYSWKN